MGLYTSFIDFIETKNWFQDNQRVLLAVSGGLDSMVMAYLFAQTNYDVGIAHCNFKLRGEDADGDQDFVRARASQNNIPFYTIDFETSTIAQERSQSIQLVARGLRYEWLEKIRVEHHFDWIATAHHLNDAIETTLYNLTKGTGIKGIQGIPVTNGRIIRPLSFASREQLEDFQQEKGIEFRLDASNLEDKYARNKIRHHVLPTLKTINPSLEQTFQRNLENFAGTAELYFWAVQKILDTSIEDLKDQRHIHHHKLARFPSPKTVLFEYLKNFGFNYDQVENIWTQRNSQPGAIFESFSHTLLIDRATFILKKRIENNQIHELEIGKFEKEAVLSLSEGKLQMALSTNLPTAFTRNHLLAFFDYKKITFPLRLRRWKAGDVFCPLGMKGNSKKVQDFFTDSKLNLFEKKQTWILEDASGKIVWIVGQRADERFKLDEQSMKMLKMTWQPT
ncbi:MAG: tRNA lysidine(34) synthetase TilS [Bacteroidota bacterium]